MLAIRLVTAADAYKEQTKVAGDWWQKALETKKKAARQPGAVGITQEAM